MPGSPGSVTLAKELSIASPARDITDSFFGGRTVATFFFDDMTADQALAYNPTFDRILFHGVSAAQVSVTFVPFTVSTPNTAK